MLKLPTGELQNKNPMMDKWFFEKTNNTKIQFVRYIFVGGIAAVVNIGLLFVLTSIFDIYYIISNVVAFIAGLTVNYFLTKKLVFTSKTRINSKLEYCIYGIIGIAGLIIDTTILWFLTSKIGIFYLLSKVISTLIVFAWNFSARKLLYMKVDGAN